MTPDDETLFSADYTDRLLGWPRVRDRVDISRTTAWRLEKSGDFPRSVQLSPGRVAWRESEIDAWKATRSPRAAGPAPCGPGRRGRPASGGQDMSPPQERIPPTPNLPLPPQARRGSQKPAADGQTAFEF